MILLVSLPQHAHLKVDASPGYACIDSSADIGRSPESSCRSKATVPAGIRAVLLSRTRLADRRTAEMKPIKKPGHRPRSAPPMCSEGRRPWIACETIAGCAGAASAEWTKGRPATAMNDIAGDSVGCARIAHERQRGFGANCRAHVDSCALQRSRCNATA
ncbi:hypothetical protein BCEP4_790029 [Burkholderia cepacia]|nr:hypothetical protein BCEP4_790029 [Burkholderia cepacia]